MMSIKITKDKNAIIAVILYGLYGLFDFFVGTEDIVEISNSTWVLVLRLLLCSAFCFSILFEKRIAIFRFIMSFGPGQRPAISPRRGGGSGVDRTCEHDRRPCHEPSETPHRNS